MKKVFKYTAFVIFISLMSGCANQNTDQTGQLDRTDQEGQDMTADPISFGGDNPELGNRQLTDTPEFPSPGREQNIFTTEPDMKQGRQQEQGIRTTPEETEQDQSTAQESNQFQKEVTNLTNKEREKNGLAALEIDAAVEKVAQKKSEDMAINNYFSHTSPTYGSPFEMLQQFEVAYTTAAENIAAGQKSPEEVVTGWMNSPGHRKNILNEKITHIGVGYAENGAYWTQLFIGK